MKYIVNQLFNEININDKASLSRTLTQEDINFFAAISGDVNPAHVDVEYAKQSMFHKVIAHGIWGAMLFSALLGTKLPGPGTIYLSQTLKFLHPITIGDRVTATVTVIKKIPEKNKIEFDCQCVNQINQAVIIGAATVLAPTEKVQRKRVFFPKLGFLP